MFKQVSPIMLSVCKGDEVAILVKDDKIITLQDSLDKLLKAYGLKSVKFFLTRSGEMVQQFKDNYGNSLIIEMSYLLEEKIISDFKLSFTLVSVGHLAHLYMNKMKKSTRIDLRPYIAAYPENYFEKILENMEKELIGRGKRIKEYLKMLYI